jgi:hypothetical protein
MPRADDFRERQRVEKFHRDWFFPDRVMRPINDRKAADVDQVLDQVLLRQRAAAEVQRIGVVGRAHREVTTSR